MKKFLCLLPMLFVALLPQGAAADEFRVVASVRPVHSLLAGLMEGTGRLWLLAESGDPRLDGAPLDEKRKRQVEEANLVVWVGPEMESVLAPLLESPVPGRRVVTLLDGEAIKVLPSRRDDAKRDPYFWLDSRNAIILVQEMSKLLTEMDPGHAHVYLRNKGEVLKGLGRLDRELEYGYRGLKGGVGVLYYDTLQYFEQAYALQIGAVLATPDGGGIDTEELLKARLRIAGGDYACLLTETGLPADQLDLLTRDVEIHSGELDSMGVRFDAGPALYSEMMNYNTDLIKSCLQRDESEAETVDEEEEPMPILGLGGGRFMLTDHNGKLFTEENMRGKFQLLYFGYTYCPDICPTALYTLTQALNLLGDKADLTQPYFITVDPERDNAGVMKKYVEYFGHNLIGLTGPRAMIDRVAQQYRVRYEKVEEEGGDPELYLMDHTASLYVIAPDGTFITKFAHGITPRQVADGLLEILP
ncbi:MAG: SCO family protein [Pseudomonadota bacterium]|nr:SCO family protein [Pseudomonadota bacterium]